MITSVRLLCVITFSMAASCASHQVPENRENVDAGQAYQARYRGPDTDGVEVTRSSYLDEMKCTDGGRLSDGDSFTSKFGASAASVTGGNAEVLSVGDLVQVFIEEDETLTGSYVVGEDVPAGSACRGAQPSQR